MHTNQKLREQSTQLDDDYHRLAAHLINMYQIGEHTLICHVASYTYTYRAHYLPSMRPQMIKLREQEDEKVVVDDTVVVDGAIVFAAIDI